VPQVTRRDFLKLGAASTGAAGLAAFGWNVAQAAQIKQSLRIADAIGKEKHSVCPYCAVGCSLIAYTREANGTTQLLQIEGDPESPVNQGRLCPKGASAMQLATSSRRVPSPMVREPGADKWKTVSWDEMLTRVAARVKEARDATFVTTDQAGNVVNRCEGIGFAGGAAFSSEEGYLATKLMRGLGIIHIEQQARV